MLLLPLDLLLLDRPNRFPGEMVSAFTGIPPKTAKRNLLGNQSIRPRTAEKVVFTLSEKLAKYDGVIFDSGGLLTFINNSKRLPTPKVLLNYIEDSYSRYCIGEYKKIESLSDAAWKLFTDQIRMHHRPRGFEEVVDLLFEHGLPSAMLSQEVLDFDNLRRQDITSEYFFKSLDLLRLDIALFLLAARDVEYGFRLMQGAYGWKPIFADFLPQIREGKLYLPLALWFDRIIKNFDFPSINYFAKLIPNLSVRPKKQNADSKLRTMRKWRRGEALPTWENVDNICESLACLKFTDNEEIQLAKEQGKEAFKFILLFQRLLQAILATHDHPCLPLSERSAVEFFERYFYWHNYHAVLISEAGA